MVDGAGQQGPVMRSRIDRVGIIELSKPDRFNCLSGEMFRLIGDALDEFERDSAIGAILITAQGKNFCTGAELSEVEVASQTAGDLERFLRKGHDVLCRLEASRLPVISAVQGLCLAGGLELVMACDVVFAADTARFGDQHAAFGLIPGWGNSQRLPRAIGLQRALDLMYSARWIDAPTAQQWGLISYCLPGEDLADAALVYAQQIALRSRAGLAAMKVLARRALDADLRTGLNEEVALATRTLLGADAKEGLSAFKEKRSPRFG
jgi:enoyl-CoA hydratase/carnithine racemase